MFNPFSLQFPQNSTINNYTNSCCNKAFGLEFPCDDVDEIDSDNSNTIDTYRSTKSKPIKITKEENDSITSSDDLSSSESIENKTEIDKNIVVSPSSLNKSIFSPVIYIVFLY